MTRAFTELAISKLLPGLGIENSSKKQWKLFLGSLSLFAIIPDSENDDHMDYHIKMAAENSAITRPMSLSYW